MSNSSDARFIYRETSGAPHSKNNNSSAGNFNSCITAADPSHQLANLPGSGLDHDKSLNSFTHRAGGPLRPCE
jgi:hypothetical protein